MITKAAFLNCQQLRKVNKALARAGYSPYPGDPTFARPNGCGSGHVGNLLDYLEPTDQVARLKIIRIVDKSCLI